MRVPTLLLFGLLYAATAMAIDTRVSYQGTLEDAGQAANGNYDLEFTLQDTAGGAIGAALQRENVPVVNGVFTVELDFGPTAFTGADRQLQIGVRPGAATGAYTLLAPATRITPAPYAQVADDALFAATIADNSVSSAKIADGAITAADLATSSVGSDEISDGAIAAADISVASIGATQINPAQVQVRIAAGCLAGQSIRSVGSDGSVVCADAGTGDVTGVTAGSGLTGGGSSGDLTIGVAIGGINSNMLQDGSIGNADLADNSVDGDNIVTGSVGSSEIVDGGVLGVDLADNSVTSSKIVPQTILGSDLALETIGNSQVNPDQVQLRVGGSCASTGAIRSISNTGSVSCISTWIPGGNAGLGTTFLGTSDNLALNIGAAGERALRIEPALVFNTLGQTVAFNMIGGARDNIVTPGVRGAVIAGGGTAGDDPNVSDDGPNSVSDLYGVVGGGANNRAGNGTGDVFDAPFASVGGGNVNAAGGSFSVIGGGTLNSTLGIASSVGGGVGNRAHRGLATVGGGEFNHAEGDYSTVPGGSSNCAGGAYSVAMGRGAKVRPEADPLQGSCSGLATGTAGGDAGTFVYADSQPGSFVATGPNQVLLRAAGGLGLNANTLPGGTDAVLASRDGSNFDLWMRPAGINSGINFGVSATAGTAQLFIARFNGSSYTDYATWDGNGRLQVYVDNPIKPTAGGWAAPSDARLKHNIQPLHSSLDRLLGLRGVQFAYNRDAPKGYYTPGVHTGFIAQEVESVFPEWISLDSAGYKLVAPKGFEALTVEALRELRAESATIDDDQSRRLRRLEGENAALRAELKEIRAALRSLTGPD